jgi:hypothetical protein
MKKAAKTTRAAKPTLPAAEWAFHRVSFEEWKAAESYEYQREAAALLELRGTAQQRKVFWQIWLAGHALPPNTDPKRQKPWMELPRQLRKKLQAISSGYHKFRDDGAFFPLTAIQPPSLQPPDSPFAERVVFDIDWRAKDVALVREFQHWLKGARKQKRGFLQDFKPPSRPGPKYSPSGLCDLVVWRGRRAGLTMKATNELMHPFLAHAGGIGKVINPIQRARSCQNAEKRMETHAEFFITVFKTSPLHEANFLERWLSGAHAAAEMSMAATLNKVSKRNRGK